MLDTDSELGKTANLYFK